MPFSFYKSKRLRFIFIVYWFLLVYIIAALVWWFIALNNQNHQMAAYKISEINKDDPRYTDLTDTIKDIEKRKTAQYIGEGSIFLLLILGGAFYIFRSVRKQFKSAVQQQNFMMAITHELKTPIAVTKLNLETLQKRKLGDAQQQRLIQNTIQEANRLNALCNNMLLASQIEAGGYSITKEEINFSELVVDCITDFSIRFPQRSLQQAVDADLFVEGDRLLLQMAINNLIDNALKYSSKESTVTVALTSTPTTISLSVKDEGRGIAGNEKKKIFDKYYRIGNTATKGAKGTGLGLFLTKKIAQQHNATISVADNNPAGSIFVINFTNAS
ncbi:two-component sensor histidine kinase [Ferruginibacter lapsinanis]|uniref:sensor histidine kinase n=1 Tax=Ferruginibacter lapsinanis TaxID=563172 RepID=UPI001E3A6F2C|nr:ATP-binding protein [Ferruginibacter lapsinanis]UEG51024.1 two-component sensor histidine kinase [Ferruginibacter lapsinanis]